MTVPQHFLPPRAILLTASHNIIITPRQNRLRVFQNYFAFVKTRTKLPAKLMTSARLSPISTRFNRSAFGKQLLAWYDKNRRDLPWRRTRDPFAILVSEFMLQQTQVSTVIPYYDAFMKRYPAVATLAAADEQEVLRLWQGLGYYSRARNLLAAARKVTTDFSGTIPQTVAELQTLPGIGQYTAGAIASIAFDARAPILDGNVSRVLCRLDCLRSDPRLRKVRQHLWIRGRNPPEPAHRRLQLRSHGIGRHCLHPQGTQMPPMSRSQVLQSIQNEFSRSNPRAPSNQENPDRPPANVLHPRRLTLADRAAAQSPGDGPVFGNLSPSPPKTPFPFPLRTHNPLARFVTP